MRRLLIIWLSVLPLLLSAANTLTLSSASGHPGDTLTITASLANTEAVSAVQADIPLGAYLRYENNSAALVSARNNGHSIVAAASNDTLHVTIFSLSGAALQGAEGDLFTFRVVLGLEPATYTLTPTVTLSDPNSQALTANVVAGRATILSPKIEVLTTSIDYGHIPIRSTYNQTLQVRNTGNEPLHISNVLFSAAEFSVAETEYTIAAGQTQNITLTFAPVLHGAVSETVRLRSDAINNADVYRANRATLIADPYSVNELRVQPASGISDDTATVVLRMNNMETDLVGIQVSFKMPSALEYIANSIAPLERAEGMLASSSMSNDTLTLMLYSLNNTAIADEDGDLLSFKVRLNGSSGSYTLTPINTLLINTANQNMVSAVYQASVIIQSPTIRGNTSINFGQIPVTKIDTMTYRVRNSGQAPLAIEGAAFLQEGFRLLTPMPLYIAVNQSENLQIEFTPTTEGSISTTMQLYSNDPVTRMKSVAVTGSVFEPNTLSLSGEIAEDESYTIHVYLSNYTPIAALQFDIQWLEGFEVEGIKMDRMNDLSLATSIIEPDTYRFIAYSLSNNVIASGEGEICAIRFRGKSCSDYNDSDVKVTGAILSDINSIQRLTDSIPALHVQVLRQLTLLAQNGHIDVQPHLDVYPYGTQVQLTAIPDENHRFIQWQDGDTAISRTLTLTQDTTMSAMFLDANTFLITFLDDDGTVLCKETWERGELPSCGEPYKEETDEFIYSFTGWTPSISAATEDIVYTATYDSVYVQYTITFEDEDGNVLCEDEWDYGTMPFCDSEPTKPADEEYTYTFVEWSPEIVAVTEDATYTAIFTATKNRYIVTFLNEDSTVLQQIECEYGSMPSYTGEIPTKEPTAQYTYTFAGWNNEVDVVEGNTTYIATYWATLRNYLITFLDEDGTELCAQEWRYGTMPSCEEPSKADDELYTYTFAGWTPEVVAVAGEATYTASYTAKPIGEGFDNVEIDIPVQKIFRDGQIYILRGDKVYTLQGQLVK